MNPFVQLALAIIASIVIATSVKCETNVSVCSPDTCPLGYQCVVQKPQIGSQPQTICVPTCQVVDCPPDTTCIHKKTKYGYVEPECVSTEHKCGHKPTNPCAATLCITGSTCKNIGCKAVCVPNARKD